jgi:hypothetical protein
VRCSSVYLISETDLHLVDEPSPVHTPRQPLHGWGVLRPVVLSLPHVGRELGCGFPIIYSSERISRCMRESTDDVSVRSESEIQNLCPDPVFSSGESSPRHVRPIAHKRSTIRQNTVVPLSAINQSAHPIFRRVGRR